MVRPEYYEKIKEGANTFRGRCPVTAPGIFKWLADNGWEVEEKTRAKTVGKKKGRYYVSGPRTIRIRELTATKGIHQIYRDNYNEPMVNGLCMRVVRHYESR